MLYTTLEEYVSYIGGNNIDNYEKREDLAVVQLKRYCLTFPTIEEYNALDLQLKDYVSKSIFLQIEYMLMHPEVFTKDDNISSFSIGKYSVSKPTKDSSAKDYISLNAKAMLDASGICKLWLKEKGCGCCAD